MHLPQAASPSLPSPLATPAATPLPAPLLAGRATPDRIDRSEMDLSVNFLWLLGGGRALEARFVRRDDDYFIVYLSSHTGCNQACRFCHLTATRQVSFDAAQFDDFLAQAHAVLSHYDQVVAEGAQPAAKRVHFNWMARGEPLLNPCLVNESAALLAALRSEAQARGLAVQFNVSSIFPAEVALADLQALAAERDVQLFYSLYSMSPEFRKRWVPKGRAPAEVLSWLAQVQALHGTAVTLHWALIEGENDSESDAVVLAGAVRASGVRAKFNLVRYNPYSGAQGREASEEAIARSFEAIAQVVDASRSRVVPRVGFDVKASCGMFVQG